MAAATWHSGCSNFNALHFMRRTVAVSLAAAFPLASLAQQRTFQVVDRPDHEFKVDLIQPTGLVEMRDGSVIVLHFGDDRILRLDPKRNSATAVARIGSGPGEYRLPNALLRLSDDTIAIRDATGTGQLLQLAADGSTHRSLSANPGFGCQPVLVNARQLVRTADTHGSLYSQAEPLDIRDPTLIRQVDSAAILKWHRQCVADTVAYVPATGGQRSSALRAFSARPVWTVTDDGDVVVVYPTPYRVEVFRASGRISIPLDYDQVRVTEAMKKEVRRLASEPQRVDASYADGRSGTMAVRIPWREPTEWPDYLPPFMGDDSVLTGFAGTIWIRHYQVGGDGPVTYSVVNLRTRSAVRVMLPQATVLLGIGRRHLYAIRTDANDNETLVRYPLPKL